MRNKVRSKSRTFQPGVTVVVVEVGVVELGIIIVVVVAEVGVVELGIIIVVVVVIGTAVSIVNVT